MSPRVTVSHIPPLRYPPRAVSVVSRTSSLDEDTIQPSLPNSASSAGSDSQMQSSQTPFLRQHSSHSTSPDNAHASGSGSGYSRNYSDTSDATPDYPLTAWGERMRNSDEKRRRERGSPVRRVLTVVKRHGRFVGPGIISSVAYIDPGNWTTDLAGGSGFGYKLLFIVLISGLAAALLQVFALRLGISSGTSLAKQIRYMFLRARDRFDLESGRRRDKWIRRAIMGGLYLLWVLSEVAIVSTDLAELLGSAIAINLLIPQIPLYGGVLITACDVFLVLLFFRSKEGGRKGMILLEVLVCSLVMCVFASFVILLVEIKPQWGDVFLGFVPSKEVFGPSALYTSVGIIGATIMPHGLYLGSELATIDRLDMAPIPPVIKSASFLARFNRSQSGPKQTWLDSVLPRRWQRSATFQSTDIQMTEQIDKADDGKLDVNEDQLQTEILEEDEQMDVISLDERLEELVIKDQARYDAEMKVFDKIRWATVHIAHATFDTTFSLIGMAITINSAILILASAAFYYGNVSDEVKAAAQDADLFSAYDLISQNLSKAAATIFAIALLGSGQSASITATLAGQVVSEGFLEWRTSPLVRRMVTRLIGIIPSVAVAVAIGRQGLSTMLVASQVVLSIVLPFVILPLVWLCSQDSVMMVENGITSQSQRSTTPESDSTRPAGKRRSFKTWWPWTWLGYLILAMVVLANSYVIVQLGISSASGSSV